MKQRNKNKSRLMKAGILALLLGMSGGQVMALVNVAQITEDGRTDYGVAQVDQTIQVKMKNSSAYGFQNLIEETKNSNGGSTAIGTQNVIKNGENTTAVGKGNTSSGYWNSLFGNENYVEGSRSVALGAWNDVQSKSGGLGLGVSNTVRQSNAFAVGFENQVLTGKSGGSAVGVKNYVSNENAVAIGFQNAATGKASYAIGTGFTQVYTSGDKKDQERITEGSTLKNLASGESSLAVGWANNATGEASIAIGSAALGTKVKEENDRVVLYNEEGRTANLQQKSTKQGSIAIGIANQSTSKGAVAIGDSNEATGENALAIGGYLGTSAKYTNGENGVANTAKGNSSIAMGLSNYSDGVNAVSIGTANKTLGTGAIAIGSGEVTTDAILTRQLAQGNYAQVIGALNSATANYSMAYGYANTAGNTNAVAIGSYNQASNANAIAIGAGESTSKKQTASGQYSIALGYGNTSSQYYAQSIGSGNKAEQYYSQSIGYSNTASEVRTIAYGAKNQSTGRSAVSLGTNNMASGIGAIAIGSGEVVDSTSDYTFTTGDAQTASGKYSVALGAQNQSSAGYSVSVGFGNQTVETTSREGSGSTDPEDSTKRNTESAIAMGTYNKATGQNAISIGAGTVATGKYQEASGSNAIAIGNINAATESASFAIGTGNIASAQNALSLGGQNVTEAYASMTFGLENKVYGDGKTDANSTTYGAMAQGMSNEVFGSDSIAMGSGNTIGIIKKNDKAFDLDSSTKSDVTLAFGVNNTAAVGKTDLLKAASDAVDNGETDIAAVKKLVTLYATGQLGGDDFIDSIKDSTTMDDIIKKVDEAKPKVRALAEKEARDQGLSEALIKAAGDKAVAAIDNMTTWTGHGMLIGENNTVYGTKSMGFGTDNTVHAIGSIVIGGGNEVGNYTIDEKTQQYTTDDNKRDFMSMTIGTKNKIKGSLNVSMGIGNQSYGTQTISVGSNTIGTDTTDGTGNVSSGVAYGLNNVVYSDQSMAFGGGNTVNAQEITVKDENGNPVTVKGQALAVGIKNNVYTSQAMAVGGEITIGKAPTSTDTNALLTASNDVTESGQEVAMGVGITINDGAGKSTAIGGANTITNANSVALGYGAQVSALNAQALGVGANAKGLNSVALGAGSETTVNQTNVVSVGTSNATRKVVNVTYGTTNHDAATWGQIAALYGQGQDLVELDASGNKVDLVTNDGSVITTFSLKNGTISAEDENGIVSGKQIYDYIEKISLSSIVNYDEKYKTKGDYSGAHWLSTDFNKTFETKGKDSAAYGYGANAQGDESVALGRDALATGKGSVAIGSDSVASEGNVSFGHKKGDTDPETGSLYKEDLTRKLTNVAEGENYGEVAIWDQIAADGQTISLKTTTGDDKKKTNVIRTNDGTVLATFEAGSVSEDNTGFVSGGDVYSAIAAKGQTVSGAKIAEPATGAKDERTNVIRDNDGNVLVTIATADPDAVDKTSDKYITENYFHKNIEESVELNSIVDFDKTAKDTVDDSGKHWLSTDFGMNIADTEKGKDSAAYGYGAQAKGDNSVALGSGSVATNANEVSFGNENLQRALTNVAYGDSQYDAATWGQILEKDKDKTSHVVTKDNNTVVLKANDGTVLTTIDIQFPNDDPVDPFVIRSDGNHWIDVKWNNQEGTVRGENSVALGYKANAQGDNSVALGYGSIATEANTFSVGGGTDETNRRIVNVANGTENTDAATYGQLADAQLQENGSYKVYEADDDGIVTVKTNDDNVAFKFYAGQGGSGTSIVDYDKNYGSVEGDHWLSTDFGNKANVDHGKDSTAYGYGANAKGDQSVAFGKDAVAEGNGSIAIGEGAQVTGTSSVAIGEGSTTAENNEVSFGNDSTKRKLTNVAEGTESGNVAIWDQIAAKNQTVSGDMITEPADGEKDTRTNVIRDNAGNVLVTIATADADAENVDKEGNKYITEKYFFKNIEEYANMDSIVDYDKDYKTATDPDHYLSTDFDKNFETKGKDSTAYGYGANAQGTESTALGKDALAIGEGSVAIGSDSVAKDGNVSFGHKKGDTDPETGLTYKEDLSRKLTNVAKGETLGDVAVYDQIAQTGQTINSKTNSIITNDGTPIATFEFATPGKVNPNGNKIIDEKTLIQYGDTLIEENTIVDFDKDYKDKTNPNHYLSTDFDKNIAASEKGQDSAAYGYGANAQGDNSVALGSGSIAKNDNEVSFGNDKLQRKLTNVAYGDSQYDAATWGQILEKDKDKTSHVVTKDNNTVVLKANDGTVLTTIDIQFPNDDPVDPFVIRSDGNHWIDVKWNNQEGTVRGENSVALGYKANAQGDNSVALGYGSIATEANTFSVGGGTDETNRRIVNVAAGKNNTDAANVGQLLKEGTYNSKTGEITFTNNEGDVAFTVDGLTNPSDSDILKSGQTVSLKTTTGADANKTNVLRAKDDTILATFEKGTVSSGNTGFVSGGDVYNIIATKNQTLSGTNPTLLSNDGKTKILNIKTADLNTPVTDGDSYITESYFYKYMKSGGGDSIVDYDTNYKTATNPNHYLSTDFDKNIAASEKGQDSAAYGYGAQAKGDNSVALGSGSVATNANEVSFGNENLQRSLTNVAYGDSQYDAAAYGQILAKQEEGTSYNVSKTNNTVKLLANDGSTLATINVQFPEYPGTGEDADPFIQKSDGDHWIDVKWNEGDGKSVKRGENSVALGYKANAQGKNSVALGYGSIATEANTFSVGGGTDETNRRIVNVAAGTTNTDAANFGQILKNATYDASSGTVTLKDNNGQDAITIKNIGTGSGPALAADQHISFTDSEEPAEGEKDTRTNVIRDTDGKAIVTFDKGLVEKDNKNLVDGGTVYDSIAAKDQLINGDNNVIKDNAGHALATIETADSDKIDKNGNKYITEQYFYKNLQEYGDTIINQNSIVDYDKTAKDSADDSGKHWLSTDFGKEKVEHGDDSTAYGYGANAKGDESVALGKDAVAEGKGSVAIGEGSVATGDNEVSFGTADNKRKLTNVAEGEALGDVAVYDQIAAKGQTLSGSQPNLMANDGKTVLATLKIATTPVDPDDPDAPDDPEGDGDALITKQYYKKTINQYFEENSIVDFDKDYVTKGDHWLSTDFDKTFATKGKDSTAYGYGANAQGDNSVAIGSGSVATEANTFSVGAKDNERKIVNVAAGEAVTDAANVGQIAKHDQDLNINGMKNTEYLYDENGDLIAKITVQGLPGPFPGYSIVDFSQNEHWLSTDFDITGVKHGVESTAFGYKAEAAGERATAVGYGNKAEADHATAVGYGNEATGEHSTAVGDENKTSGDKSAAYGYHNEASGDNSTAIGTYSKAEGDNSVAMGNGAEAKADDSMAFGTGSIADESKTASFGSKDADGNWKDGYRITNIADGIDDHDAATVGQVNKIYDEIGNRTKYFNYDEKQPAIIIGDPEKNKAEGKNTTSIGFETEAKGEGATAIGDSSKATGDHATALGYNSKANTNHATALGDRNDITGEYSTGVGAINTVNGEHSIAAGCDNTVTGDYSVALGHNNTVSGNNAYVIGGDSKAAEGGIVIGKNGEAGKDGIVIGNNSKAAEGSTAIGGNSVAKDKDEISFGHSKGDTYVDPDSGESKTYDSDLNRKLTHVADGSGDNDAANMGQLNKVGERVTDVEKKIDGTNSRISEVETSAGRGIAGASALAALHPLEFDPDDKASFAVGYGHFKSSDALALGAFYRPNESVLFSLGGVLGNGEDQFNAGISFALGRDDDRTHPMGRVEMSRRIQTLQQENAGLNSRIDRLERFIAQMVQQGQQQQQQEQAAQPIPTV